MRDEIVIDSKGSVLNQPPQKSDRGRLDILANVAVPLTLIAIVYRALNRKNSGEEPKNRR